jgi:hypothetical protein
LFIFLVQDKILLSKPFFFILIYCNLQLTYNCSDCFSVLKDQAGIFD